MDTERRQRLGRLKVQALNKIATLNAMVKGTTFRTMQHYRATYTELQYSYRVLKDINKALKEA